MISFPEKLKEIKTAVFRDCKKLEIIKVKNKSNTKLIERIRLAYKDKKII